MRIPDRYLPHRITLRPRLLIGSSTGEKYGPERGNVRALVADKVTVTRDQRSDSTTAGEEITSSAHIVMDLPDYVEPGALVRIHIGTPAEREGEVVSAAYTDVPKAPRSAQLWIE